jgi:hypothetical protein
MSAAYTWSHLIDDSTAEVFSTVLTPRRPQDFRNLGRDKSDSALDRRHRFVLSGIYDLPFFANNSSRFVRAVLGGFSLAGTLTFESGEKATVLSGVDANLNGDAAGDRTIINLNGAKDTSTLVYAVNRQGQRIQRLVNGQLVDAFDDTAVAYVAINPNAQYVQAQAGARATAGRNTLLLPGINNVDFSVQKNFALTEGTKLQFRADFINAFNHPQYVPGTPNSVTPIATTAVGLVNTVGSGVFGDASQVFSSNPRIIQLALRLNF